MRQSVLFTFASSLFLLAACSSQGLNQSAPLNRAAQPAAIRQASAPQAAPDLQARYSFRKPVGTMKIDMYIAEDREGVNKAIKEFFAKYVDQNDIVNYQMIEQQNNTDVFFLNIFGGNKDFVLNRLLPDLKVYLMQRSRFDSLHHYAE